MMADEDEGLNWSFDSLQIIVPRDTAILLQEHFDGSGDGIEWSVSNPFIDNAPRASLQEEHKHKEHKGISIYVWDRDLIISCFADAPSTAYASFVTPSAFFCAYPVLTLEQYAIATNRFPSFASLRCLHALFKFRIHATNESWDQPCHERCPSLFRRLASSFAIIPFHKPREDLMWMLDTNRWWKVRADCHNRYCPYFGYYLV